MNKVIQIAPWIELEGIMLSEVSQKSLSHMDYKEMIVVISYQNK